MIYYCAARESNAQSRITFHLYRKNTNWWRELPAAFTYPFMGPFNGANFASKGRVISCRLANRVGSRFETNRKLLPEIIGPISTPNDYLNASSDEVFSLRGSCRNNMPAYGAYGESFLLQFSPWVWSLFFWYKKEERNMLFVGHPVK